ncbi:MAG: hypothetical protein JWQ71_2153 [Pedosphaera sp.]|nr:hypothetical protein [Pedosphaera sp.]
MAVDNDECRISNDEPEGPGLIVSRVRGLRRSDMNAALQNRADATLYELVRASTS